MTWHKSVERHIFSVAISSFFSSNTYQMCRVTKHKLALSPSLCSVNPINAGWCKMHWKRWTITRKSWQNSVKLHCYCHWLAQSVLCELIWLWCYECVFTCKCVALRVYLHLLLVIQSQTCQMTNVLPSVFNKWKNCFSSWPFFVANVCVWDGFCGKFNFAWKETILTVLTFEKMPRRVKTGG